MLKKILSKLKIKTQEKKLLINSKNFESINFENYAGMPVCLDGNVKAIGNNLIISGLEAGTYKLIIKHDNNSIFKNVNGLVASFDLSDVIKIESKQFRLGLSKYSQELRIHEYFNKGFQNGKYFIQEITLRLPHKITFLEIKIRPIGHTELKIKGLYLYNTNINNTVLVTHGVPSEGNRHNNKESKELIWETYQVTPENKINMSLATSFLNIQKEYGKAVLLIKGFNRNGLEIDIPLGKLAYSEVFQAYFKYVKNTNLAEILIHSFIVPEEIFTIKVAVTGFNLVKNETIQFLPLNVKIEHEKVQNLMEISDLNLDTLIPYEIERAISGDEDFNINVNSVYNNCLQNNKKALLLFQFFDKSGVIIEGFPKELHWSKQYNAFYKYLPDTSGKNFLIYNFKSPANAASFRIGIVAFNLLPTESIVVNHLIVSEVNETRSEPEKFIVPSKLSTEVSILSWECNIDKNKPTVMGVMDEFTTGCFESELNLIQPRPDNWYGLAEKYQPSLFFIESAWKGNQGSWQYRVADYANKPGNELEQMCQYAKERGIPTIFWNKEDPVHHQKFMCSAKLVDHILTTDSNMKNSYFEATGNQNVHSFPFAAQPTLHKPTSLDGRLVRSCFAGTWYGNRHEERGEAMRWLLAAANKYGLDIYDRNFGTNLFPYPDEYQSCIKGSLPYKELCNEYGRYRVFLNVNSVTESPTMFSRRVFELMASGTPVVSTYAKGIEDLFESDAVWLVRNEQEAEHAIYTLLTDDKEWKRRSLLGIREVFSRHTYAHRLNDVFEKIGIPEKLPTRPKVLLISKINFYDDLVSIINEFSKQVYENFTLLIETNLTKFPINIPDYVKFVDSQQIVDMAVAGEYEKYDYAGWVYSGYSYGSYYLQDLINAIGYQPHALGWGKSTSVDIYDFNQLGLLGGSLWKLEIFIRKWLTERPTMSVQNNNFYIVDSSDFNVIVRACDE